jgi:hypothetical protein
MTKFYWECDRVGREILQALALGLNLEDIDYLTRKHGGHDNQLRLLHYLAVPAEDLESERVSRCAAHTDWSSITMLFQDDCGGLEVEDISRPGTFRPASRFETVSSLTSETCCRGGVTASPFLKLPLNIFLYMQIDFVPQIIELGYRSFRTGSKVRIG